MKRKRTRKHFGLLLMFAVVVFLALLANSILTGGIVYLLIESGVLHITMTHIGEILMLIAVISIPIGLLISMGVSKIPLKPFRDLIKSMDKLASGDFHTRVSVGPVMAKYPPFVEVCESFNKMAQELESTEMLRKDFINNFSHEFKTPIVSIAGFAKLLKRGNLSEPVKQEYINVIEEESLRLSYMATNVLNLTKVENQSILTNVTSFNLSEQIRGCILLLENKWDKKNLDFLLSFGEHTIHANEELLKQVWINLLDNAIKFSPQDQIIEVRIAESPDTVSVSILNTGPEISTEEQKRIFNKFYQADQSHAAEGNGVGLAIVKRVTELHGGSIQVSSNHDITSFTVELPKHP